MDAVDETATASSELANWRSDVRLRALARRVPEPVRAPLPVWIAVALASLLFALFGRWLNSLPRPLTPTTSVQVFLRDELTAAAEPALPVPPLHRASAPARVTAQPMAAAAPAAPPAAESEAVEPPSPLHIFNPDGSIDLPAEATPRNDALVASFDAPPRSADGVRIMKHVRALKVRPNHFAGNFRASSSSTLTDFVDEHLTVTKEFTLPWGTHVECKGVGLGVAWLGGCGWYTPYRYYVPQALWRPASVLDEQ